MLWLTMLRTTFRKLVKSMSIKSSRNSLKYLQTMPTTSQPRHKKKKERSYIPKSKRCSKNASATTGRLPVSATKATVALITLQFGTKLTCGKRSFGSKTVCNTSAMRSGTIGFLMRPRTRNPGYYLLVSLSLAGTRLRRSTTKRC